MKLLIITQKVDLHDDLLGFFHQWLKKLAAHCESIIVVSLGTGEYSLPQNVKVLSLGKEQGRSPLKYLKNFYKYLWQEHNNYDMVFVHMVPLYVNLGVIPWKVWNKKIVLWYAHYLVDFKLRLAGFFSDMIVTSTQNACRLQSIKLKIVGQGIDVDYFLPPENRNGQKKILFLGRISPVKDLITLIEALAIVKKEIPEVILDIVGSPIMPSDHDYLTKVKELINERDLKLNIIFHGKVGYPETRAYYQNSDLFVNLTKTGSFDKTTLEAMSCELPVVVCNQSFANIFPPELRDKLIYEEKNSEDLAQHIINILNQDKMNKQEIGKLLRTIIIRDHSLDRLITNLVKVLQ